MVEKLVYGSDTVAWSDCWRLETYSDTIQFSELLDIMMSV